VNTRVAHPLATDPWARVALDLVDLMLEANLPPTVAERLAFELAWQRLRHGDPSQDGAWDEPAEC